MNTGSTAQGYWKPSLPDAPKPKRSLKPWIISSAAVVVVGGLLGGSYIAYSKGYISIPGLSPKSDQLFDKMINSISDVKNAQYSLRFSLTSAPRSSKATQIFVNANTNTNANTNSPTVTNTTPNELGDTTANKNTNSTVNSNSNLNTNSFQIEDIGGQVGLGTAASALGYYSDTNTLFKAMPADVNLNGGITFYIEADKKLSQANGSLRIDGSYTGADLTVAVDLEARKKNGDIYGIINKFPSFFLVDLSGLKGKWIKLNSGSAASYFSAQNLDNVDMQSGINSLKTTLRHALQEKMFTVKKQLPAESIAGVMSQHYLIAIDTTKIPSVYDDFIADEKAKGHDTTEFQSARDSLNKPEVRDTLKRIADNSQIEIWVDKVKGMLRQTKWELTVVPPDGIERLNGKQFVMSTTLTLDKVNEPVSVDAPSQTIDMDEAERLLTGITKEEQQAQFQYDRITQLQSALTTYKSATGAFPDSLDQLNPKFKQLSDACKQSTNTNAIVYDSTDYNCYSYNRYAQSPVNITDAYTGKTFMYAKDGADFKVTYEIHVSSSSSLSYYSYELADGKNTMTSKDLSLEKVTSSEQYLIDHPTNTNTNTNVNANVPILDMTTDSDGDGIPNYYETSMYSTDPNKKDTDGDGYDDRTEICSGYNPLGTGKYSYSTTLGVSCPK